MEVEVTYQMRYRIPISQILQYFLIWNQPNKQWEINQIQRVRLK